MKRTVFRISSSGLQRQRGMARVALIGAIAATFGGGVFVLHYDKFTHQKHVGLTTSGRKTVQSGCGCGAGASSNDNPTHLKGVWTPPASSYSPREIATLPTSLLLQAGKKLPLIVNTEQKNVKPGGTWSAEYGVVDKDGEYTAPPYTPQEGIDTLTYQAPQGSAVNSVAVRIHILPNPQIPGSQYTPYLVDPMITGDQPTGSNQDISQVSLPRLVITSPATKPDATFLHKIAAVPPGEVPAPAAKVTSTQIVPVEEINGVMAYRLPSIDAIGDHLNVIYVPQSAVSNPLQEAKELPQYEGNPNSDPDPRAQKEGKCKEGTSLGHKYFAYRYGEDTGEDSHLGSFKITDKIAAAVKPIIDLSAEIGLEVDVLGHRVILTRTRKEQFFVCRNGKKSLDRTLMCSSSHDRFTVDPAWAAPYVGRKPVYIIPEQYPPDECKEVYP